jgi:5-formyltetrahydrofolate cyclo-ligase
MDKKALRAEIRKRKSACSVEERAQLSSGIVNRLCQNPQWLQAHTILLYHSLPDEVCTHDLIRQAAAAGKRVLLPVVVKDELELREYSGEKSMKEGAFHIQEPTGSAVTDLSIIDLAVIPGVAFTPDGRRLGRGRGYYDRLLARLTSHGSHARVPYLIGICWPFQLVTTIPTEPHDICVDCVIT